MNFCSHCGAQLSIRVPEGDNLPRHVCDSCGTIHYVNPKIVAGCIAQWQSKILLCKRAIEPRLGLWTLPAGFMEQGETTQDAAARESWEEACAKINDIRLFGMFSLPHISQVYMMFHGELHQGRTSPGVESLEVGLFDEADIPWNDLAFAVVKESLELYFEDRRNGGIQVHVGDIVRDSNQQIQIIRY